MAKIKAGKKPSYRKPIGSVSERLPDYAYPTKIEFLSSDEVAEFKRFSPKSTHRSYDLFVYEYTLIPQRHPNTPSAKLGTELPIKLEELKTLESKGYVKCTYGNS